MYGSTVMIKCKQCGKNAPSNEFVLDPVYRMMVCLKCSRERQSKAAGPAKPQAQKVEETPKERAPAGWDADDESLIKIDRYKKAQSSGLKWIDNDRIKYKCAKCGFAFIYSTEKRYPMNCPNCGTHAEIKARRF